MHKKQCQLYLKSVLIGFSFMQEIETSPNMSILSVMTKSLNSGLILSDYKTAAASIARKSIAFKKLSGNIKYNYWRVGMSTLAVEMEIPYAQNVVVTSDTLNVDLSDGRTISAPLAWFPRLLYSTQKERNNWRLIGRGHGIHWGDIDEDISVEGLLAGRPSGESQTSFKKWLAQCSSRLTIRRSRPPKAGDELRRSPV